MAKSSLRILIVEDDKAVADALGLVLGHAGYNLSVAHSALEALRRAYEDHPDLILLDVNLPDQDGFAVLRRLREQTDAPIIMLTARTMTADRVRGLDGGAADYIVKPFDNAELLARIRARLRDRRKPASPKGIHLVDERLSVDLSSHLLLVEGRAVELTPIEWRILRRLLEGEGRIVSFDELLRAGWKDYEYRDARDLKVRISAIRKKIGDSPHPSRYIHTERELGYRFDPLH
jgi:DNA-binding response OmpR family regulator